MNPIVGTTEERRHYRSWPEALKREIVAASYEPGSSVSLVARRFDVNVNQVFAWRKLFRESAGVPTNVSPQLVPVMVEAEQPRADTAPSAAGGITIEVGRYRVCIGDVFDGRTLRRILDVLEER